MDRFENVTAIKKANIYYDGKVTSRTILFADGSRKTLGILLPGQYEFATAQKERMEILCGSVQVMIPEHEDWETFLAGHTFDVPANVRFLLYTTEVTDYCCSYLDEQ